MNVSQKCALTLVIWSAAGFAQGFTGKLIFHTKLVLQRKLPAAVKLPGSSFAVKTTAERPADTFQKLAADKLQSTVETTLVRFNTQLQLNPEKPDVLITAKVLECTADAATEYSTALTGKNKGTQQPSGVKVHGRLVVTYQAHTRVGGFLDAQPIDIKYDHDFNNLNGAITETKKVFSKIPHPGRKREEEEDADEPHNKEDVVQLLVDRVTQRIAARLVNTNEQVEVFLARGGALTDANRYAEAGQWTKYVETLETMPPFPSAEDDSYRLYDIGVGNEALGYKAETPSSAKSYFEKAVIDYRKAGEANPHERYFIEPVNRIEIALEHYKSLSQPTTSARKGTGK